MKMWALVWKKSQPRSDSPRRDWWNSLEVKAGSFSCTVQKVLFTLMFAQRFHAFCGFIVIHHICIWSEQKPFFSRMTTSRVWRSSVRNDCSSKERQCFNVVLRFWAAISPQALESRTYLKKRIPKDLPNQLGLVKENKPGELYEFLLLSPGCQCQGYLCTGWTP